MRQRNRKKKPMEKQDFFSNLPPEIILIILSRLPVRTVGSCKCVCKSWLNLLETDEFAKSHLSQSVPGLAVNDQRRCQILEFEDRIKILEFENTLNLDSDHDLELVPVTKFEGPYNQAHIYGSANGLLFMYNKNRDPTNPDGLLILNPITREYLRIPEFLPSGLQTSTYGFGVSRITGQHKLVRIFHVRKVYKQFLPMSFRSSVCEVYTVGTGLWRSVAPGPVLKYDSRSFGAFLNGNLHWFVYDLNGCPWISCFDLEDEVFSIFPSPPLPPGEIRRISRLGLNAMEDCLCLRDSTSDDEIVIWLMKDYGDKKSWMKEFVISSSILSNSMVHGLIKVNENGLVAWADPCLFYHHKRGLAHLIESFDSVYSVDLILHTSSFVSLKSFVKEKVLKF